MKQTNINKKYYEGKHLQHIWITNDQYKYIKELIKLNYESITISSFIRTAVAQKIKRDLNENKLMETKNEISNK